jgi:hypothetical protein
MPASKRWTRRDCCPGRALSPSALLGATLKPLVRLRGAFVCPDGPAVTYSGPTEESISNHTCNTLSPPTYLLIAPASPNPAMEDYQVPGTPFFYVIDGKGIIANAGFANTLKQLETLVKGSGE